ncbi:class I SAM-dependent methyltransferase [Paenibacillus sp. MBLB4367]|uniref:class I SAM-dependent methyltransferase n=1 Tax=Paenibacillus sp. MBLB4367 TaxID=3384767 RepID=UPI003907F7B4
MLITTSYAPSDQLKAAVNRLADGLEGKLVPRRQYSLPRLRSMYGDSDILVANERELRYYAGDGTEVYFHPSNGYVRIKRMRKGESDLLIEISGASPGDSVLDCTAGLAADAIVFAYAVGPTGTVTALESSPVLACLLREGLSSYTTEIAEATVAMRAVRVEESDHLDYLRRQPDRSFDIVYFDPMFRKPIQDSSSMSPIRSVADMRALTEEAVAEAKRVARRCVILKEHRDSGEFERLGFTRNDRSQAAKTVYGVIEL